MTSNVPIEHPLLEDQSPTPTDALRWASRLRDLCIALRAVHPRQRGSQLEEEVWLLLHAGLSRYLRLYARRRGGMSREDLEDVASERTLDLLHRVLSGRWDPSGRHPGEVAAFLATCARNAVMGHARRIARRTSTPPAPDPLELAATYGFDDPAQAAERREAAITLTGCVERLAPRARRIWFMRVMLDLPSSVIAAHPDVRITPEYVDVILQRARGEVRACFEHKGFDVRALPRNAFVDLWDHLVQLAESERGSHDSESR